MTLAAWVNPASVSTAWQDVIYKGNVNYFLMASSSNGGSPVGGGTFGTTTKGSVGTAPLAANTWTYLATTYDGSSIKVYVNGVQVSSVAMTGAIKTSLNPLQIGGDTISGQNFKGLIDEVRVYNRSLTQAEIQADMAAAGDLTAPTIGGVSTSNPTAHGVTVAWTTDEAADSQVEYGTSTSYGSSSTLNGTLTSHSINLSGLADVTNYHYRVRSRDASGNLTLSADSTFTTPADTVPPTIGGVTTSNLTASGATMAWATDEAADTQVEYGTSTSYGSSSTLNTTLATSHLVNLSDLSAVTTYHYRVRSRDAAGNLALSGDFSFTTPPGLLISNSSIAENSPINALVGALTPDDGNTSATHTFTLLDSAGGRFKLVGNQLQVATGTLLDYESATSHNITVQVSSTGGPTYQTTLTISLVNVNEITGFDVQKGLTERSYVRYVDLVFESSSALGNLLSGSRMQLTRFGLDGTSNPTQIGLAGKMSVAGNTLSLNFGAQGIGGNRNSNVGDGYYSLSIDQDGDGVYDATRTFYRLFGNVNSDRIVDNLDLNLIVRDFGKQGSSLNADVNGDGVVNSTDRSFANQAKGRKLAANLTLND